MKLLLISSTSATTSVILPNVTTRAVHSTRATAANTATTANQTAVAEDAAAAKRAIQQAAGAAKSDQQSHSVMMDQSNGAREGAVGTRSRDGGGLMVSQYLPYTVCGAVFAVAAITALLAYVLIKRRRKAAASSLAASSPTSTLTSPEAPKQHQILRDSPKFSKHLTPTRQQPTSAPNMVTVSDLEDRNRRIKPPSTLRLEGVATAESMAPKVPNMISMGMPAENIGVVRIKTKGLLERRGSNASLTIDVNPIIVEAIHLPTPPKECSVLEYLSSAGNRMTRRQLRTCLKNPKVLHEEFLDIPLNHSRKLDLPGCNGKNRYKSIWPNEETRVVLPQKRRWRRSSSDKQTPAEKYQIDDQNNFIPPTKFPFWPAPIEGDQRVPSIPMTKAESMDDEDAAETYINANYIRSYDNDSKAYIAAQGPLPNTIDDFWTMVWHERCPCIVMMTRLQESNRVKCENYLPNTEAQYGDVHVQVKNTTTKAGYSIRELILRKDGEIRHLKHFWFTSWPDHKAPSSTAKQLIELVQDVEAERHHGTRLDGPVVVHCSAGLGRTGCFIATSIGMKQLRDENMVDILGIVCQLRMDRGGMIQTVEQYEFIHHALIQYERQLPETPGSTSAPPLTPLSASNRSNSANEMPTF